MFAIVQFIKHYFVTIGDGDGMGGLKYNILYIIYDPKISISKMGIDY